MNISKGQRLRIHGRDYEFFNAVPPRDSSPDTPHDLQFRDLQDHRVEVLTQAEFDELYGANEVAWWNGYERPKEDAPEEPCLLGEGCPGCDRCRQKRERRALQGLMKDFDENPVPKTDADLQAFLDARAAHWPAGIGAIPKAWKFRVMLRTWGQPGDRRLKYIGDRRSRVPRRPRIDPLAEEVLWEQAEVYWTDRKVTSADVHASMHTALTAKNRERAERGLTPISIPSKTTVWRMLTRHSDYDNTRRRFGTRVAQRMFKPLKGKLEARRILDVAVMDHTVLDCFVVDDEHNIPVGRPYLTVLIDVRSRVVPAWIISFTPPSVETAMACLRQAVRPKDTLNERYPGIAKWEVFGVPRTVLVDNGWEFTGRSFKDACEDAGITIEWAPVKTPEYKGIVERFFATLNRQLIHKLKGSVPFKPHKLAEYGIDPQAEAVLLLSEVEELIHQYVVEVYSRSFHSGINAVPEQVWRERQAIDGIDYAQDLKSLDLGLAKLGGTRVLDRKGLEFKNLNYSSNDVFDLLDRLLPLAPRRGQSAGTVKVKFKYWPEDLSKIAIWNEVDRAYVDVPCTSQAYARGLSEHHHEVLVRYARENGLRFSTEEERCEARSRLNKKIASFVNDRLIGTRRRAQRLKSNHAAPAPLAASPHEGAATMIPIETVSNRNHGDILPKLAPKYGRKLKRNSEPASRVPEPPQSPAALTPNADVFAAFDRVALLSKFRNGGQQ